MLEKLNQPRKYDVVLGGKAPPPLTGVVLGGIAGVKQRLQSKVVQHRIAALTEAVNYQDAGLELVIQALDDESQQVRDTACFQLQGKSAKLALLKKDAATWNKWRAHSIRLEESIYVDLSVLNLSELQLCEFNLSSANLIRANLSNANLSGANLSGANLSEANLMGANLSGAMLSGALLYNANLTNAILNGAILIGANLQRSKLHGANFDGAVLHKTTMPDGRIFE